MAVNLSTIFVMKKAERFACGRVFRKGQAVIPTRAMLAAYAKAPMGAGNTAAGELSPGCWQKSYVGTFGKGSGIPKIVWVTAGSGANV